MFRYGVRSVVILGIFGAGGLVPAACLFAPIDYSAVGSGGEGACSAADGCFGPSECKVVSCRGETCETTNASPDKPIAQISHDCLKRRCDGSGNVAVVPDPDDLPVNDGNACTIEDCDDATSANAPAGAPCLDGICDGLGTCASCGDGIKNGNETGVDCGGSECPQCNGEACGGVPGTCQSDHCVDGVCCDEPCDQKCEACMASLTGVPTGTCAPLLLGKEDGSACSGLGGCGIDNLCACEDGVKNQGEVGIDCGGPCSAGCIDGTPCKDDFDCTSGACSSGVCCETSCDGACERCDAPGQVGHCKPLAPMSAGTCPQNQVCDVGGACRKKNGESCATALECASGVCAGGLCSP